MKHKTSKSVAAAALLTVVVFNFSALCVAATQTWQIDPNHTAAQFSVRHLGISTVRGVFEKTTGTVSFDSSDPSKSSIDVTIDAKTVNTRVAMRDGDLRSAHFLDVAKYPTITFKSTQTEVAGPEKLRVTGDLTIHGVSKQVVLDVEGPSEVIKDPMGSMRMGAECNHKDQPK